MKTCQYSGNRKRFLHINNSKININSNNQIFQESFYIEFNNFLFIYNLAGAVRPGIPVALAVPTVEVYGPQDETTNGSSVRSLS